MTGADRRFQQRVSLVLNMRVNEILESW